MGTVGILYWLEGDREMEEETKRLERESGVLVYHASLAHTAIGRLLSLLYVSPHEEEWGMDREDLGEGRACCYVCNLDDPQMSEYGWIACEVAGGGIVRTA